MYKSLWAGISFAWPVYQNNKTMNAAIIFNRAHQTGSLPETGIFHETNKSTPVITRFRGECSARENAFGRWAGYFKRKRMHR